PIFQTRPAYFGAEPLRSEIRLKTSTYVFQQDYAYAMPPSPEVDAAWSSLLPQNGGFFTHPRIAPTESCVAVFHQIHCLDMLRKALFEARLGTTEHRRHEKNTTYSSEEKIYPSEAEELNASHDMDHLGHCFDLLRQVIMCRPDLTIEVANVVVDGVTGFDTEHQCIDWAQLMDWMEKNE
ncbi:hypothetical protein BDP55DRAFT_524121, partial [Colletotrichum godetiae]